MVSYTFNPFTGKLDALSIEDLSPYVPYTGATADIDLGNYAYTQNQATSNVNYFGLSNIRGMRVTNAIDAGTGGYFFFSATDNVGTMKFDPKDYATNVELRFDGEFNRIEIDNPILIDASGSGSSDPDIQIQNGTDITSMTSSQITTTDGSVATLITAATIEGSPTIIQDQNEQDTNVLEVIDGSVSATPSGTASCLYDNAFPGDYDDFWTGNGTSWLTDLSAGDLISINGESWTVKTVSSDTQMYTVKSPQLYLPFGGPTYGPYSITVDGAIGLLINSDGKFESDLLPEADSNFGLGSTSLRWINTWTDNLNGSDVTTLLSEVSDAYAHITADGSSHTFINQSVTTTADPTFNDLTLTTNLTTPQITSTGGAGSTFTPIAHYLFNDDATDEISGYDFTTVSGATYNTGKINNAIYFDGIDDYAQITDDGTLDLNSDFSISFWMRSATSGSNDSMIEKWQSTGARNFVIFQGSSGVLIAQVSDGTAVNIIGSTDLSDDAWHHVVFVRDRTGDNQLKLYVDNSSDATPVTDGRGTITNNAVVAVGRRSNGTQHWQGYIDDLRFYDKALSTEEISAIYNSDSGTETSTLGGLGPGPLTITDGTDTLVFNQGGLQFDLSPAATVAEGLLYWNEDDGTLNLGMPGGNVNLQLGQEMVIRVRNETGSQITNGSVVYISGESGNKPLITLADADLITAHNTIGVATEDIDNNSNGYITTKGFVRGLNTSAYSGGDVIYLSQTAGAFTSTAPTSPAHRVRVGQVITAGADGSIYVNIEESTDLGWVDDVLISSIADKDILYYDSATSLWKNQSVEELGYVPYTGATADLNMGSYDVEATEFRINATADHTITNSSDDLTFTNYNSNAHHHFGVNVGGTQVDDFVAIGGTNPQIAIDTDGNTLSAGNAGVFDVRGSWSFGTGAALNFAPTVTSGNMAGLYFRPTINSGGTHYGYWADPDWGNNNRNFSFLVFGSQAHTSGYNDTYTTLSETIDRQLVNQTGNMTFNGIKLGKSALVFDLGGGAGNVVENQITLTGGGTQSGASGSLTQTGLKYVGFGTYSGNASGVAMTANGGIFEHKYDYTGTNNGLFFGAADDAGIGYDGTNLVLDPKIVGSGLVDIQGDVQVESYERHVQIPVLAVGNAASQPTPVDVGTAGGYQFASSGVQEELHFQWEVPDDWDGTDIVVEIDWLPDSGAMTNPDAVKWVFEYRAVAEGESIVNGTIATQSVTYNTTTSQYVTVHSPVTFSFNDANQPLTKQDHLYVRCYRDTSVANDFSGTVVATAFEILYNSNKIPRSN